MFNRVCLIGIDVVGASLVVALRRSGFNGLVYGVADIPTIKQGWELGIVNDGSDLVAEGVENADLIIMSMKAPDLRSRLETVIGAAKQGAVIVDMSYVKAYVDAVFTESNRADVRYVGFRMVDPRISAMELKRANKFFFEDKTVILTPREKTDLTAYGTLHDILAASGAYVIAMSPKSLDKLIADYTHIPRILMLSVLESVFLQNQGDQLRPEIIGTKILEGLNELNTLSRSDWLNELEPSRELIAAALDKTIARLEHIKESIREGKLDKHINQVLDHAKGTLELPPSEAAHNLIVVTGSNTKRIEKVAILLAEARLGISKLDKMINTGDESYKLTMNSSADRDKAINLLQLAGIEAFHLS